MSRRIVLEITELNRPLITVLNGGLNPHPSAEGHYFICEIDGTDTTTRHDIIDRSQIEHLEANTIGCTQITHLEV